jgi:hypothetical protein
VQEMRDRRAGAEEAREKDLRRKEFELMTKFGSRTTRFVMLVKLLDGLIAQSMLVIHIRSDFFD